MTKPKSPPKETRVPNWAEPLFGVIKSTDEVEYGLRGVVRILSGRGKAAKNGYFFEGFKAVFGSEIGEDIQVPETYLDHEHLKIIIKLPDPVDPAEREPIRHHHLRQYTMGADSLKTRAAVEAFASLDEATKQALIEREKEWTQTTRQKRNPQDET